MARWARRGEARLGTGAEVAVAGREESAVAGMATAGAGWGVGAAAAAARRVFPVAAGRAGVAAGLCLGGMAAASVATGGSGVTVVVEVVMTEAEQAAWQRLC